MFLELIAWQSAQLLSNSSKLRHGLINCRTVAFAAGQYGAYSVVKLIED
jgi:hypothetical protein